MERRGRKEYIQVLRLLKNFSQAQVERAIKQALGLGVASFDAIKHNPMRDRTTTCQARFDTLPIFAQCQR